MYHNPHYIDIWSKLDLRSGDKEDKDKDKEKRSLEARGLRSLELKNSNNAIYMLHGNKISKPNLQEINLFDLKRE